MSVRKAVIPAAGLGTRFLPASKAVPKNLIPIIDKPMIQYAVEELALAGIKNICIVISQGSETVADHFGSDPGLESVLERSGKTKLLEDVRRLQDLGEIYFVHQHVPAGLGHAVGVARDHIGDEPFAVLLPDELFDPKENFLGRMLDDFDETGSSVIAVNEVPREKIGLYGAIDTEDDNEELMRVRAVIEKPSPEKAPSTLAVIGRYVLVPEVFDIIAKLEPGAGGEIQLTDALHVLATRSSLLARRYGGRRWDVGNKEGYLEAIVELGADHPELGERFRRFLEGFVR